MDNGLSDELLFEADHVKYRKAGEGRSPIGRIFIYKNFVEWRDNQSSDKLQIKFVQIKGQRVSPPSKDKVQLQICLQNDDQATFVFLDPALAKEKKVEQRDVCKETLQQALLAHRARVNQLAASQERGSKQAELEAKQRLLRDNQQLEMLYQHLVVSKLITPNDFWTDHYKSTEACEEATGVNGAFLASIAQQDGTNGIKLNLNPEIIRAIFSTYPAVERKHLELVPHEMTEQQFWSKFFQSHYYHREREVLPNPSDPFSDCVKLDEGEIENLLQKGVDRRRFDLNGLDDNSLAEYDPRTEIFRPTPKTTLVRRCNYLSERIVSFLKTQEASNGNKTEPGKGFSVLHRIMDEDEERLESSELTSQQTEHEGQGVRLGAAETKVSRKYGAEEGAAMKRMLIDFLNRHSDEDLLRVDDDAWMGDDAFSNGNGFHANGSNDVEMTDGAAAEWVLTPREIQEVRNIHESVTELLKHFWVCFPPITPELEAKVDRMKETLERYEQEQLANAARKYGNEYVQHCHDMFAKAYERYAVFDSRRKK